MTNRLKELIEGMLPEETDTTQEKSLRDILQEYQLNYDQLEKHLEKSFGLGTIECPDCGGEMKLAKQGHIDHNDRKFLEGKLKYKCTECGYEEYQHIHI